MGTTLVQRERLRTRAIHEAQDAEMLFKDPTPEQQASWEVAREALRAFLADDELPGFLRIQVSSFLQSMDKPRRWLCCAETGTRLHLARLDDVERQEAAGAGVPFRHRGRWCVVTD